MITNASPSLASLIVCFAGFPSPVAFAFTPATDTRLPLVNGDTLTAGEGETFMHGAFHPRFPSMLCNFGTFYTYVFPSHREANGFYQEARAVASLNSICQNRA